MKRKPIQILVSRDILHALCNDGTIWLFDDTTLKWIEVHGVPQPEVKESSGESCKSGAIEVLEFLNKMADRCYKPVDVNLDLITARLKESSVQEMKSVIALKCRQWKNTDMEKFLRPETIFNRTKFAQYQGELKGGVV